MKYFCLINIDSGMSIDDMTSLCKRSEPYSFDDSELDMRAFNFYRKISRHSLLAGDLSVMDVILNNKLLMFELCQLNNNWSVIINNSGNQCIINNHRVIHVLKSPDNLSRRDYFWKYWVPMKSMHGVEFNHGLEFEDNINCTLDGVHIRDRGVDPVNADVFDVLLPEYFNIPLHPAIS